MPNEPIVFDSVRFVDRSSENLITIEGLRQIGDLTMVPSRGDFVRLGDSEEEFIVCDRHFHFSHGACSVVVNIQPASRVT